MAGGGASADEKTIVIDIFDSKVMSKSVIR